jgi:drug/metabolite transporter (DMT)-like permease
MEKSKITALVIVFLCTIFTSFGQLFLKMGASDLKPGFFSLLSDYPLIAGFALYGFGAILFILSLRFGELSMVYPIISLSFIWVLFLSSRYLHEPILASKVAGVLFILAGVSLIGRGGEGA